MSEIGWIYYLDLGLKLGLSVADLDNLTPGIISDLAITRINQENNQKRASQTDFDEF